MNSQLSTTNTTRIDRIKNSNLLISSIFQFDTNIEKKFKHEIWEIKKNIKDSFVPISNETSIKIEIIADLIANTVDGIYELDIPEERIIAMTREIEEFMMKGEKLKEISNKKELALKSLSKVNYKIFIPMIPKLGFGSYEYQLRPLFPKYDLNNGEEPYILIKSYKPKGRRNSSEDNVERDYKDCSGCEPQLVEYCKNCGRVLVNGKHPSKSSTDDHFGSPPSSANLKRELIHMLYTDIYPFIFFTTFIASLFGAGRLWTSAEEKMSFFIGTITNKLIQFRDNLNEELQALFKN